MVFVPHRLAYFTTLVLRPENNHLGLLAPLSEPMAATSGAYALPLKSSFRFRNHSVTGQGPGPEWICPGPAGSVWVLDFSRKDFTTGVQETMRVHLLMLGTVKQGRD